MDVDAAGRRTTIDGATRRRLYLFRHGSVDYIDAGGNVVPDTDAVALNTIGQAQAASMRNLFASVQIDKAQCSGLKRTRETAEIVLGDRDVPLEINAGFLEIRQLQGDAGDDYDIVADIAYSHFRATDSDAQFLGGERYSDFYARIQVAMEQILKDDSWHSLAVFAHGATNAAVLGWVTGIGCAAFGALDQATCCLNVIDIDVDESGSVLRKTVRAMNVTADDPAKSRRTMGDMESLAYSIIKNNAAT